MQWVSEKGRLFPNMRNLAELCFLMFFAFFLSNIEFTLGLSCKDDDNQDVDWFINYKLPKFSSEDSNLNSGEAYAYITSESTKDWYLSPNSVKSTKSMLGRIWKEFDDSEKTDDITYLFYNDDSPGEHDTVTVGHTKGFFVFDGKTGFWLIHSIPRFGDTPKYEYPDNALVNGQIAMCVTFDVSALNKICEHLLYCHPNIYESKLSDSVSEFLDENAATIFSEKPAFIRRAPFVKQSTLQSLNNQNFVIIAKDNQYKRDIYSDIIAPFLKTSLLTETWRRGSGGFLDPYCKSNYSVVDITAIKMKAKNTDKEIFFKSTEDHSKWAISVDSSSQWICIGDLNRMNSQARRGGGAICFEKKSVWKAFNSIIYETDVCPLK